MDDISRCHAQIREHRRAASTQAQPIDRCGQCHGESDKLQGSESEGHLRSPGQRGSAGITQPTGPYSPITSLCLTLTRALSDPASCREKHAAFRQLEDMLQFVIDGAAGLFGGKTPVRPVFHQRIDAVGIGWSLRRHLPGGF